MFFQKIPTFFKPKFITLPYSRLLSSRILWCRLLGGGLLTVTALPLYAKDSQAHASSCDIYKLIEQANKPIALSEFKQTPNGINIYSENIALQVANFQLCQASVPFSRDEKAIAEFVEFEQIIANLANQPITDYPKMDSLSHEQIKQYKAGNIYYREQVVELYFYLSLNYYLGDIAPKNDEKAILYMNKVVNYIQQQQPKSSVWLDYKVATGIVEKNRHVSPSNPITLQHKTETGLNTVSAVLLSKAGHLDSKAMLRFEAFKYWRSTPIPPTQLELELYLQPTFLKLESYAKQGSYTATKALGEIYTELTLYDKSYKRQANYWQLELDKMPQTEISWH